jgi:NAD(P)H dehydrogenase (quinone)
MPIEAGDDLILVASASGKTGIATVEALRERGIRVRALVRSIDQRVDQLKAFGAEVIQGDLLDFHDVSSAVAGVTGAYFCYPIEEHLLDATAIFAQAASEAGVRAVVNMSQISARREAKSHAAQRHWLAERLLDRTAMNTTHIRPTFFAEWLPHQWSAGRAGWTRDDGAAVLRLPFGEGRHAPIAAADQGRFVAAVLANPAPHDGQIYPLCGPVDLNHYEIADKLSEALGITVRYEPIEISAFAQALSDRGYPPFLIQHLSQVAQDYQDGIFAGAGNLIEAVTGTPAMTVNEFAIANKAPFEPGQHPADKRPMR